MTVSRSALDFDREGRGWPLRAACRFVEAGGLRWCVLDHGSGPAILLLHGTGAATHSFRGLAPLLAARFRVIAPDLPGHGFTGTPIGGRAGLPAVARAVGALCRAIDIAPAFALGHSAGAAILARMCLDGLIAPRGLIAVNGAFFPFRGLFGQFFSPLAKLLALNPLVPSMFAWQAGSPDAVAEMIAQTGSRIDAEGVALYARLLAHPGHVAGALGMMAGWNLGPLEASLPRLAVPLLLLTGAEDRAVPPAQAYRVRAMVPSAEVVRLRGLGHLAHEERPAAIADHAIAFADRLGRDGAA